MLKLKNLLKIILLFLFVINIFPVQGITGILVSVISPAGGYFAELTQTDVTVTYTTSNSEFSTGDEIEVKISPALISPLSNCSIPSTDLDQDSLDDGSFINFSNSKATYKFTNSTTNANTSGILLCIQIPNDTTAKNYTLSIKDNNDENIGATILYVGEENLIRVSALVPPTLSFVIRTDDDTQDQNTCNFGLIKTTEISTCSYRLRAGSATGYTVNISANQNFQNSNGYEINNVTNDGLIIPDEENYGIDFDGGSATLGIITELGDFSVDPTPLTGSTNTSLYNSNGANAPIGPPDAVNTALVTHKISIDDETRTGIYTQLVTYTITPII